MFKYIFRQAFQNYKTWTGRKIIEYFVVRRSVSSIKYTQCVLSNCLDIVHIKHIISQIRTFLKTSHMNPFFVQSSSINNIIYHNMCNENEWYVMFLSLCFSYVSYVFWTLILNMDVQFWLIEVWGDFCNWDIYVTKYCQYMYKQIGCHVKTLMSRTKYHTKRYNYKI